MEMIDALEAEENLYDLIDRAEKGECFVITRNGIAVAYLKPHEFVLKDQNSG